MTIEYFASCPKSLEGLLFNEVKTLGADSVRETVAGAYFQAEEAVLYRVCLWSRLANKIFLPLVSFELKDVSTLYDQAQTVDWAKHLSIDNSFRVDFSGTNKVIRNSQFGALRTKDAIADWFQSRENARPSVSKDQPDIIINARLSKGKVHISLDLSGQSLHRRGYRLKQGEAPLKENLAAAILLRANWLDITREGGHLIDPMCGSGTLLIEGLMMAADIAPGLMRQHKDWGFTRWPQFNEGIWTALLEEAGQRKQLGLQSIIDNGIEYRGYDHDWRVLDYAQENIERAGFENIIRLRCKAIDEFTLPTHKSLKTGLLISNPPYGERLSEEKQLEPVYFELGKTLKNEFIGWHAAIITSNTALAKKIGLQARKKYKFWNGSIASELFLFSVQPDYFHKHHELSSPWGENTKADLTFDQLSDGSKMVYNRIKKNQKQLSKWIKNESIGCYRVYDADIPEYAAAIDIYDTAVHVQEYAAPKTVDENKAKKRFYELLDATTLALEIEEENIFTKQRRRNKGKQQYNTLEKSDRPMLSVKEGSATLLVNLWSYLDTGLFLDHRPVRNKIAGLAVNKSFLNLFCYTATATVYAALAGASDSVSVDMSKTYIEWAKKNFIKNNINLDRHQLVQADCLAWLNACRQGYDVIFLDPPSFSNSKRMETVLDIQKDHTNLIDRCMELLLPGGTLVFSTNLQSFKFDILLSDRYTVEDISQQTLDPDFQRNRKIHYCWLIKHKKLL
jgi:23S rRNA (guanine2445-N2)-methyltransferase / 23S rRNA (guanine2069-N7)-methyltransferase